MDVSKDGRSWRVGTSDDVAWLAGHVTSGLSITAAIPPVYDAYATFYPPGGITIETHERDIGATATVITALQRNPLVNARPVRPDEDALPPGLTRE